jgi:divalent metal cation (Fe/Co/Zn/Cd) transporter
MKESLSGLMDEAIPPATLANIKKIISTQSHGAIEAHDLRTRRAGSMTFIDFHLVVAGTTTVSAAHKICDNLEGAIRKEIGEALITIHVEPDDKAKHSGIVVL